MISVINTHYPATEGCRAEVISVAYGSCDLCGARCEESRQYDGWTDWSQATAILKAKGAGWLERMSGRVSQLICPQCLTAPNSHFVGVALEQSSILKSLEVATRVEPHRTATPAPDDFIGD